MTERPGWGRLFRTVRHLTARQISARISLAARHRIDAQWPQAARAGLAGPARLDPAGLRDVAAWQGVKYPGPLTPRRIALAAGAAQRRFTFLNRTHRGASGGMDWQAAEMSLLWRYQLHYTDYVTALAHGAARGQDPAWAEGALALIDDWIAAHPPAPRPAWDPYPISLRVVNWIAALVWLDGPVEEARRDRIARSLAAQGRYVARHLEWHLGGNHLLKNAKAMLVLGMALDCPEAPAWRMRGATLFAAQIRRQVLADGGHYERSPLYHCIVLEDLLDVLALAGASRDPLTRSALEELREIAVRMTGWLARMRHPDGGLSLFNDGAMTMEPSPADLLTYAARVLEIAESRPQGSAALGSSGYYVMELGPGRAIVDCGAVGPDELPAHGHADTLGFELTWEGRRLIVDAGTSEYAMDEMRRYFRSTAAHNTVRVDEVEQSEVWGSHRVGRRAHPLGARLTETSDRVTFSGAHDGYARLGVIHHRHVVATNDAWVVVDELRGRGRHRFESHLHFHPDLRLEPQGDAWKAIDAHGAMRVRTLGEVSCRLSDAWYSPDFGCAVPAPTLTLRGEAEIPVTFGYVLAPRGAAVEMAVDSDASGINLRGTVGGRPLQIHNDRCTFSS